MVSLPRVLGFLPLLPVCLIAALSAGVDASADEVYTFVVKKQEEKAKKRWSLSEWLETRDRMRLMDMWLALHTPSPYEFYVNGAYKLSELATGDRYAGMDFSAAAYASIFGLEVERESESGLATRYNGLFHLRFFGYHYQATHLRLEAGLRQEELASGVSFRNALAGLGAVTYFGKHFGIEGLYRHAFGSTPNSTGLTFAGDRYEGGAFIDFSFVRVYGKYVHEVLDPGGARSGPLFGLKLFF